jgi:hypothetical protein
MFAAVFAWHGSCSSSRPMESNGSARWYLIVRPDQRELFEVLNERLEGSGVEVLVDRRARGRRRGRPSALMSAATVPREGAEPAPAAARPAAGQPAPAPRAPSNAVTHRCPTCSEAVELELPRFPHPPARVEMEVAHATANGRDGQHYAEIAAFTVSGRLILSQRVPARRPA